MRHWGLTARRGRANSGGRAAIPSHDDSGIELTRLSDNVRKVKCWFSHPSQTESAKDSGHYHRINAVLAAAGYNFSLLLRWFEERPLVDPLPRLLAGPLHLTRCRKTFFTAD
jgi:hypothetical protein